jgi:hypothetical protein
MRVLVHLQPGADVSRVAARLKRLGASEAPPPTPELPGVMVCVVSDAKPGEEFVAGACKIRGVRHVEMDSFPLSF